MTEIEKVGDFQSHLEDEITTILQSAVSQEADPDNFVVTWWNTLQEFDINKDVPIVIVTARTATQSSLGEIGTAKQLWVWLIHIYYIDVEQVDFNAGRLRRAIILQNMKNALENTPRLNGLTVKVNPTNTNGAYYEYVYDSNFTTTLMDSSGQDGYWAFTTELYLNVNTARNNLPISVGP